MAEAAMSFKNSEQLAWEAMEAGAYDRAVRLLQPLAEGESEYGLLCLGYIYEMGKTGPPDMEAARSCYERAAARGSGAANFEIGRLLLGERDEKQARRAFQRGTERGDLPSMAELGRMMVEGRGGSGDAAEGWAWLEKAAAQGHFTHVYVDRASQRPVPIPADLRAALEGLTSSGGSG